LPLIEANPYSSDNRVKKSIASNMNNRIDGRLKIGKSDYHFNQNAPTPKRASSSSILDSLQNKINAFFK